MTVLQEKSVKGPLHHAIEEAEHMAKGLREGPKGTKTMVLGHLNSYSYEI
jgi:hypothetical protein